MSFYRTEPTYSPDNDTPDTAGVTCRGCNHFILDNSNESAHKHGGWWFCESCFYGLPEVREALNDIAVRGDYEVKE